MTNSFAESLKAAAQLLPLLIWHPMKITDISSRNKPVEIKIEFSIRINIYKNAAIPSHQRGGVVGGETPTTDKHTARYWVASD